MNKTQVKKVLVNAPEKKLLAYWKKLGIETYY